MDLSDREPTSGARRRRWISSVSSLLGVLLMGCMVLPVPTPRHGKGLITEETLAGFEEGRSTRTDVLLTLGDPLERYAADRFFVYAWNETHGYLVGGVGYQGVGAADAAAMEDIHRLVLDFDLHGVLVRKATLDSSLWTKQGEADAWVQSWIDEAEAQGP